MSDPSSLKCSPWEALPIPCFTSYLQLSADNIFVYIFYRVINFSVRVQIITLCNFHLVSVLGVLGEEKGNGVALIDIGSGGWDSCSHWEVQEAGMEVGLCIIVVNLQMHCQSSKHHVGRGLQPL